MQTTITILYVEDDETLSFVTRDNLTQKGYQIIHYGNGQEVLDELDHLQFDLAILDIMLPGVDGFTVASEIRKHSGSKPILFLSAKSLKEDRLRGFSLGADDYITKPFSIEELLYKIDVFVKRRLVVQDHRQSSFKFGNFEFDNVNLELKEAEGPVRRLTQREADLLEILVRQKNNICKRADILEKVWGENDYFMGRSLDVFISRLRKYLSTDSSIQIENIHSVGFKLKVDASE